MEVDVAIVGAGPAGSTLATLLARRGVSVALIDSDTFPRDKVCGEFLSHDALPVLDHLGIPAQLDLIGAPEIDTCRVISGRASREFRLPAVGRGISRFTLDKLLFDTALRAGARRFDGWSAELTEQRTLMVRRDAAVLEIRPRVIAGAWGRWGRIDRALNRPFLEDRQHRYFGFKRHYMKAGEEAASRRTIELHSFEGGYLGAGRIEDGLTNVCGLVHHSRIRGLKGGWESFARAIAEEQESLRTLFATHQPRDREFLSSEPVIFVPKSPVEQGMFMLGDAAGLVDPLTGNGMAIAVQSALLAAPAILTRLTGSSKTEEIYRASFRRFFQRRLWWSRKIAYLLCRPALLAALLRTRPPGAAGRFLVGRTRGDRRDLDRALKDWFGSL